MRCCHERPQLLLGWCKPSGSGNGGGNCGGHADSSGMHNIRGCTCAGASRVTASVVGRGGRLLLVRALLDDVPLPLGCSPPGARRCMGLAVAGAEPARLVAAPRPVLALPLLVAVPAATAERGGVGAGWGSRCCWCCWCCGSCAPPVIPAGWPRACPPWASPPPPETAAASACSPCSPCSGLLAAAALVSMPNDFLSISAIRCFAPVI